MLSVAETTTHGSGIFGPDSHVSIGIDFSDMSEVVAMGAVTALPESQGEKSVLLNVTQKRNVIRGGSAAVLLQAPSFLTFSLSLGF